MNSKTIVVGSVTYAMKAKDILFSYGIRAYIEKMKTNNSYGCGYALKVKSRGELALKILYEHNIKVLSVINEQG